VWEGFYRPLPLKARWPSSTSLLGTVIFFITTPPLGGDSFDQHPSLQLRRERPSLINTPLSNCVERGLLNHHPSPLAGEGHPPVYRPLPLKVAFFSPLSLQLGREGPVLYFFINLLFYSAPPSKGEGALMHRQKSYRMKTHLPSAFRRGR